MHGLLRTHQTVDHRGHQRRGVNLEHGHCGGEALAIQQSLHGGGAELDIRHRGRERRRGLQLAAARHRAGAAVPRALVGNH